MGYHKQLQDKIIEIIAGIIAVPLTAYFTIKIFVFG